MDKTPADVLEEAADLLLIRGRCTGTQQDDDGKLCARGAIAVASGLPSDEWYCSPARETVTLLERRLLDHPVAVAYLGRSATWEGREFAKQLRREGRFPVFIWNDVQRGEEADFEVIDTLRLVAKDLRNEAAS